MRVSFEAARLERPAEGSVVSIGVFDGVHLGHRAILERNVSESRALGAEATVVTFRRHPKKVLLGRAPRTLTTLEHRLELFARIGIEHCVALAFDEHLRALSATDFVDDLLVARLGARAFVLGFDSKFGHGREGGPDLLRSLGHRVEVVDKVSVGGRAVSSTAIREAVELGDLHGAAAMLGRRVSVFGRVVRGRALGRSIGFATANLDLHHELHPPVGVYACFARVLGAKVAEQDSSSPAGAPRPAVANIGHRPTVEGGASEPVVEVHLLDFEGEMYGQRVELEFVERLRDERRFDGVDALRSQIAVDVARARELLAETA